MSEIQRDDSEEKICDLRKLVSIGSRLPEWLVNWGERKLGLHALNVAHRKIVLDWRAGCQDNFFKLACKYLTLNYDLTGLENIPKEGPCVVVCNHPHGMSDGLMFGDVVMKVREDIRVVVNEFLHCVRGMRPYQITVDVYGGEAAKRANMAGMREILRWLKDGHCILVFPSGSVASYSPEDKRIIDDPWQANITSLIRKTKATVVPMHISGHTGKLFQYITRINKNIRGSFLAREILRDSKMRHKISLGTPIPPTDMESYETDEALSDYLRLRTMLLSYETAGTKTVSARPERHFEPIPESAPAEELQAEIDALPPECLYFSRKANSLNVYAVEASQIPKIMREMGIRREITFRAAGEGTGTALDLDKYDEHYLHLIMWDEREHKLAGAYRMGRCDQILDTMGIKGVYNTEFFTFDKALYPYMRQGLEMGRAFIAPEYQRLPVSLDTLWMGIGRYLVRHPEYRYLFGTVSISQDYDNLTRSVILSYLRTHEMHPELAGTAKAFSPPSELGLRSEDERLLEKAVPDIKTLTKLIQELENNQRSIPILLKQYLRMGGKMIAFGIDNDFGGVLDSFVIVDMHNAPEKISSRYLQKADH